MNINYTLVFYYAFSWLNVRLIVFSYFYWLFGVLSLWIVCSYTLPIFLLWYLFLTNLYDFLHSIKFIGYAHIADYFYIYSVNTMCLEGEMYISKHKLLSWREIPLSFAQRLPWIKYQVFSSITLSILAHFNLDNTHAYSFYHDFKKEQLYRDIIRIQLNLPL